MPNYEYYRELLKEAEDYLEDGSDINRYELMTELTTALRELIPPIQRVE